MVELRASVNEPEDFRYRFRVCVTLVHVVSGIITAEGSGHVFTAWWKTQGAVEDRRFLTDVRNEVLKDAADRLAEHRTVTALDHSYGSDHAETELTSENGEVHVGAAEEGSIGPSDDTEDAPTFNIDWYFDVVGEPDNQVLTFLQRHLDWLGEVLPQAEARSEAPRQ